MAGRWQTEETKVQIRKHLSEFIKRETMLCIAGLLAVVSAFFVPPDGCIFGRHDCNRCIRSAEEAIGDQRP